MPGNGAASESAPNLPADLSPADRRAMLASLLAERRRQPLTAPLTPAQHRLWLLDQLRPGSPAYGVTRAIHLAGTFTAGTLRRALGDLVQRHQALRTHFAMAADEPVQVVAPGAALGPELPTVPALPKLPEIDLSRLGSGAARQAEALAAAVARRPLPLDRGPLLRVALLRLAPGEAVLLFQVHHIVVDGWSSELLLRELAALLGALAAGGPSPLPPPLAQFVDFVAWQRRRMSDEQLGAEIDFWRRRLAGAPLRLDLPTDRPRPDGGRRLAGGDGALAPFRLPAAPAERLRGHARAWQTTPFVCVLAAVGALLQRLAGAADVVLLTPVANRPRAEWAGLCGMCVETVVLRLSLGGDPDFATLAGRAREAFLDALAHPIPFDRLVAELHPERRPDEDPLSQVMVMLEPARLRPIAMPGLRFTPRRVHSGTAKFDLLLDLEEAGAEIGGDCEYDTGLFDGATVKRLLAQIATLMAAAAADPALRLSTLPLLGEAERHQLLIEWSDCVWPPGLSGSPSTGGSAAIAAIAATAPITATAPVAATAAGDFTADVARQAALAPRAVAVTWGRGADPRLWQTWTYTELDRRAALVERHLRARGVGVGMVVAVCAERSPELMAALLAAVRLGACFLPVDPHYPAARQRFMLEDSAAPWVLTQERLRAGLESFGLGCEILGLDGPAGVLTAAAPMDFPAAAAPLAARRGLLPVEARRAVTPGNLAYLLYTSGSTGQPKGVAMPRATLANLLAWQEAVTPLAGPLRTLQYASLCFDVSFQEIFSTWHRGGTLVLVEEDERRDPAALLTLIETQGVERIFVPFVALRQLAEAAADAGAGAPASAAPSAPRLRQIVTAGEQLAPTPALLAWLASLPDCRLENHYGPTETHIVIAWPLRGDPASWPALPPIGRPVSGCRPRVLDRAGEPVPIGVAGELYIGGRGDLCLARGYLARPATTAERFLPDPLTPDDEPGARRYRTGDLARYRPDGTIDFLGRLDDQVKIRGVRVEPGEIEAVLAGHPGLAAAAVVAQRGADGEQRLIAAVVAAGEPSSLGGLRAWLAARLPEALVPSQFVLLPALPLTPSGKLDRAAVLAQVAARRAQPSPSPAVDGEQPAGHTAAPRGELETLLAELWSQLLERRPVGRHDHFFALGGHSLLAARAASRLRRLLGVELPLRTLFEAPTPAALAQRIAALRQAAVPGGEASRAATGDDAPGGLAAPEPVRQERRDGAPLSFAQQRLWFLDRLVPGGSFYHLGWALHLAGRLDRRALEQALTALVARHEALRTRFVERGGGPAQDVSPAAVVPLPYVDLATLGAAPATVAAATAMTAGAARERLAARLGSEWLRRPFDLARGPVARFALLRLAASHVGDGSVGEEGSEEHVLLFAVHHISADGWSLELVARELGILYRAAVAAAAAPPTAAGMQPLAPLPPPPLQYLDFAVWQRRWLTDAALAGQLAYWRRQLAGCPQTLDLPADRPRPRLPTFRGRNHPVRLPAGLTAELRRVARDREVTLFMVGLAVFSSLLGRHAGSGDLAIGSGVAGRTREELEGTVGLFVNTVVLRCDLGGSPTLAELLPRVRETTLGAVTHQELPFERLVEELQPERDLARTPLFQVVFDLLPVAQLGGLDLGTLRFRPLSIASGTSTFDLILSLEVRGDEVGGLLQSSSDLFDYATGERLLAQLAVLLAAAAAAPGRRLDELPLLAAGERHQLLLELAGTAEPSRGGGLAARFVAQALARPTAVAVTCGGETLTYGELHARAGRLARQLRRRGVGPEVRVAVILDRSPELVVALLAVLMAGGAYVPLDPTHPVERLRATLADCRAAAVVTRGERLAAFAPPGSAVIDLERPDPAADTASRPDAATLATVAGVAPPPAVVTPVADDALAYVIYTSGSTGKPKGVAITQANVLWLLADAVERLDAGPADVWTLFHSAAFDYSVWEMWGALLLGGRLVVVPWEIAWSPAAMLELLARERVTVLSQTPSAFAHLVQADALAGSPPLPALRWVVFAGEALNPGSLRPWVSRRGDRRPRFSNLYGITETTVHVTWRVITADDVERGERSPIGLPLAGSSIDLLDAAFNPVPLGVPGEIHVGGAGLARCYAGRPDLTAARFVPDPAAAARGTPGARLYRSGDLARRAVDGELEYLGRMDRQIKLRGFRIEPGEIEAALGRHPAVAASAVRAAAFEGGDRRLVAWVVPDRRLAAPLLERLRLAADGGIAAQDRVDRVDRIDRIDRPAPVNPVDLFDLPNGLAIAHLNRAETEFLYREIFAEGAYLKHGVHLPPAAIVFDVGANIGMFTLYAAAASPGAQVYAFEPLPEICARLRVNARLYGVAGRQFECGLAAAAGEAEFLYYPHASVLSGRYADPTAERAVVRAYLAPEAAAGGEVEEMLAARLEAQPVLCTLRTLSDVIRECGVEHIDLLKIDAEKSELDVLAGLDEADWPRVRQLVVEVHDRDGSLARLAAQLGGRGFRVAVEQDAALAGTGLHTLYALRPEAALGTPPEAASGAAPAAAGPAEPVLPESWTWSSPTRWAAALRSALVAALPGYMIPAAIVPLAALPLTTNGKLDAAALPDPTPRRRTADSAGRLPLGEVESTIAAVWSRLLGGGEVGVETNFFDLGGHSLLMVKVHAELHARLGRRLSMVDLFRYPTVATLAAYLATAPAAPVEVAPAALVDIAPPAASPSPAPAPAPVATPPPVATPAPHSVAAPAPASAAVDDEPGSVAVIGMSGRFPGAANVDELWANLVAGVESIRFFSPAELAAAGVAADLVGRSDYVPARGMLAGADLFDAAFFGFTDREAEVLDPQQRLLLECAWEALEDAGYPPEACPGPVGVFAGVGRNGYRRRLEARPELLEAVGDLQATMANLPDFAASRVSYKLDLRGPSLTVQTACSTSLVAVHLACRALAAGECDLALAGGVAVRLPQVGGHRHVEGAINSPDGHCRPFDVAARGTVNGDGAGVVTLKRLADARRDGDAIRAVIRGSAVNNDGARRVGYAAPGIDGQAAVIAAALTAAGVDAASLGYVEAHGTATPLGDPIEVAALTQAFAAHTRERGFCALGSLKGNLGHLDAAAGIAGFIKTVLVLEHRQVPPSLHFTQPNPRIDFAASPFFVNSVLRDWPAGPRPRRAAVSSFGVGGTNAHAVLEEAPLRASPALPASSAPARGRQLLLLSARTPAALAAAAETLRAHLAGAPAAAGQEEAERLADVAYTLQAGRRAFPYRRAIVAGSLAAAVDALAAGAVTAGPAVTPPPGGADSPAAPSPVSASRTGRPVIFLFPGQGDVAVGSTAALYRHETAYREAFDECAERLRPHLGADLRQLLFPPPAAAAEAAVRLARSGFAQPALFAIEVSLARLWQGWGVAPAAVAGHSLGELAAATVAGVVSLDDALFLVTERGRLGDLLPPGLMLIVQLGEDALRPFLARAGDGLAVAVVNSADRTVVAGRVESVERLERELAAAEVSSQRLRIGHPFHSPLAEPGVEPLTRCLRQATLRPPTLPFLSSFSGRWLSDAEVADPAYWATQLCQPVRFVDALGTLLDKPQPLFLEVGPGQALTRLARRRRHRDGSAPLALASLEPEAGSSDEPADLLRPLGALWCAGVPIDWSAVHAGERRRRVRLPTYPFERRRFWIEDPAPTAPVPVPATPSITAMQPMRSIPAVPAAVSPVPTAAVAPAAPAPERWLGEVRALFGDLLGEATEIPATATFLELGADSLTLIAATRALERRFGLRLPFRSLLDELATPARLASHLAAVLPPLEAPAHAVEPPAVPPHAAASAAAPSAAAGADPAVVAELARGHLRVMEQLLEILRGAPAALTSAPVAAPILVPPPAAPAPSLSLEPITPAPFVPFEPLQLAGGEGQGLSSAQQSFVAELVARTVKRCPESRRLAAVHRPHLADPRATAGWRRLWKDMVFPLVSAGGRGSRLRDVDGNEYVDFTMGYGVHLFGHSPAFVEQAIVAQLRQGVELGPRSPLAGEVARGVCAMTGHERAAFCATGSEAVMTALRLVRAVTRRRKVAMFAGSYHGAFDGTLGRAPAATSGPSGPSGPAATSGPGALPLAPGVLPGMVADLVILEYGSPRALEQLRALGPDLAAVLVEPVQSRRPDLQPREFLRQLRALTRELGAALVLDEVVTGFRLHPRGAQGWLGLGADAENPADISDIAHVSDIADIAIYGKVLGGGLPIGVVAGKAAYLDAIDGGAWQYGDDSLPAAEQTFFACTFAQHPLSMAAAHAVLGHLQAAGPSLQAQLNERGARLAARLDAELAVAGSSVRAAGCGSIFRFLLPPGASHGELLAFQLAEEGIFLGHGRPAFLSTAHSDDDLDRLVAAVAATARRLRTAGFLAAAPDAARPSAAPQAEAAVRPPQPSEDPPAPRSLPLTTAQEQLWVLAELDPAAAAAYNQSLTLRLRGRLDVAALRDACQQLADRHEALRIGFGPRGDEQIVHAAVPLPLEVTEAGAWPAAARAARTAAWIDAAARQPFDLAVAPLGRARLLRLAADEHLLVLTFHHIVLDGWSFSVLLGDLRALYTARLDPPDAPHAPDVPPPIAAALPPAAGFSRYVEWQRELAASPAMAAAERFWLDQYAVPPAPLELPADRPRPAERTFRTAWVDRRFAPGLWAGVRAAGARRGATPMATLLATFAVLLYRLSGQRDLAIGISAAGQAEMGEPDLVGYCVAVLPLRARLADRTPFAAQLAECSRGLLDAVEHQCLPLGALLQRLALPRGAHPPLAQVSFNLDRAGGFALPGVTADIALNPSGASDFDLDINFVEEANGNGIDTLRAHCDFNAALWDRATVQRWLGHCANLLAALAAGGEDAERPIADLDLLTAAERWQLRGELNDSHGAPLSAHGLLARFAMQAAATPSAVAVTAGGAELTYAALDAAAGRIADRLLASGLCSGVEPVIALLAPRGPEYLAALLAVWRAGAVYLPLDPAYPPARLRQALLGGRCAALLVASGPPGTPATAAADDVPLDFAALAAEILAPLAPADRPPLMTLADLLAPLARAAAGAASPGPSRTQPAPAGDVGATGDALAYVIFTSGSTGTPKGAMVHHAGMLNHLEAKLASFDITAADRLAQTAPQGFDVSLWQMLAPLLAGATVHVFDDETVADPARLLARLEDERITFWETVPALFELALEAIETAPRPPRLDLLRWVMVSGEALPPALCRRWYRRYPGVPLANEWGVTECSDDATHYVVPLEAVEPAAAAGSEARVPIGGPLRNCRLHVLGAGGDVQPLGVVGELAVGGVAVGRGYRDDPARTAERFVPDPFAAPPGKRLYRAGDLARRRADGSLDFLGRVDHQVKVRGLRLELGDVESALAAHPDVQAAVAMVREVAPGDPRLVAWFVPRGTRALRASHEALEIALRSHLRTLLPAAAVPSYLVALAALPLLPSGKLDRRALPPPVLAAAAAEEAPATPTERETAAVFAAVLHREPGVDDDFFVLGGYSLKAVQALSRLRAAFGVDLTLRDFFAAPTVRAVAARIEESLIDKAASSGELDSLLDRFAGAATS